MSSVVELAVEQQRREHSRRTVASVRDAAVMLLKEEASEQCVLVQPDPEGCHSRCVVGT
jgi:hypothetical protein